MVNKTQITAIILAGGRSKRMQKQDKGLLLFNKKPLIQYTIEAVKEKVADVFINANRNQNSYQKFSKNPIISDDLTDFQGPLAGLEKGMQIAKTPYILLLPCDCPMIGEELVDVLKEYLIKENADISVAHDGERLQPTFALLKTELLGSLTQYLEQGDRKIDLWYQMHNMVIADLSQYKDFFVNLNSPYDYALFSKPSVVDNVPILGFTAFSGTGKTTLITQVISQLKQHNVRCAFVKHAHHSFEIDQKGKDSYECYHAGADQVLISSYKQFALMHKYPEQQEMDLSALINQLDLNNIDLVLVEGFKEEALSKIELSRKDLNHPPLFKQDENIIAVASNGGNVTNDRVVLDINNIKQIVSFILAYVDKP